MRKRAQRRWLYSGVSNQAYRIDISSFFSESSQEVASDWHVIVTVPPLPARFSWHLVVLHEVAKPFQQLELVGQHGSPFGQLMSELPEHLGGFRL
jgi:hypothetical protein